MESKYDEIYSTMIKSLDEVVSETMVNDIAFAVESCYQILKEKGYISNTGEGSGTACKYLFAWIGECIHGGKLPDWTFRESHINNERLSDYGMRIIRHKKNELIKKLMGNIKS